MILLFIQKGHFRLFPLMKYRLQVFVPPFWLRPKITVIVTVSVSIIVSVSVSVTECLLDGRERGARALEERLAAERLIGAGGGKSKTDEPERDASENV